MRKEIKMDLDDKLRFMLDQQVFGAIRLRDDQQFIGTVNEIDGSRVIFLDHSPGELNPIVETTFDNISSIAVPQPKC
jgi:hypothetical protein